MDTSINEIAKTLNVPVDQVYNTLLQQTHLAGVYRLWWTCLFAIAALFCVGVIIIGIKRSIEYGNLKKKEIDEYLKSGIYRQQQDEESLVIIMFFVLLILCGIIIYNISYINTCFVNPEFWIVKYLN